MTYKDFILAIPKMQTDRIRELVAFLKLELQLRDAYEENRFRKEKGSEE